MLIATQYFVRRVSTRASTDEDVAMSSQTWGPFATEELAQEGLAKALRQEAKDLKANTINAHLTHHEFYVDRAAKFEQAAYMVELHGLMWTRVEGISYSIREVKKNAIGNVVN